MFSDNLYEAVLFLCLVLSAVSCASGRRVSAIIGGDVTAGLAVSRDYEPVEDPMDYEDHVPEWDGRGDPMIMNAIKDELTGEMVASDVILASRVVARFRNVAERDGKVSLEFDIIVPQSMLDSRWKLKFNPCMRTLGDTVALEPVFITGKGYRDEQMKGYRRYQAFIDSIIRDSSAFIRQAPLEIFLKRHFPDLYMMKTDSSYVSDMAAQSIFGVSVRDAVFHYTRHGLWKRNERKKDNAGMMFRKYVRDPFVDGPVRLDTVIASTSGDIIYRYIQNVGYRPGMKRVDISLDGSLYEDGRMVCDVRKPEDIVFYISSLSSLADMTPRYVLEVIERQVSEQMEVMLDFRQGRSDVDVSLGRNMEELSRMSEWVDRIAGKRELEIDSVLITASCSPEGAYSLNSRLAKDRAEAVSGYVQPLLGESLGGKVRTSYIPENWDRLVKEVEADSLIGRAARRRIAAIVELKDKDEAERRLKSIPEYAHLKESVYPKLRCVNFRFHLHRVGMVKDTLHTTRPDTLYMRGVEAIRQTDYKAALGILRPYNDYNTALALLLSGYEEAALDCLKAMEKLSPKACYLQSVVLSRLGEYRLAEEYFRLGVEADPSLAHRANLDPEVYGLLGKHRSE